MSDPLFSIIIPTFQSEQTIHSCISSILDQTFGDFEIIVQDGLSSDKTASIIQAWGDDRIKLFSEKDRGVYDAMNSALDRVSGRWILFLGSDDLLFERSTLASLSNVVQKTDADLVYGNVIISGDSHWIKDGTIYRGETDLATLFVQNLSHQSILYHRRIFEDGLRFKLIYPICADFDLNLRCFAHYKTEYTPLIMAVFTTGGISTVGVDERFENEKWENIIRYYRHKLSSPAFIGYKGIFRKTGKLLIRKGEIGPGISAMMAYLYLKLVKLFKTSGARCL
ncbi:glycosyltransferase family 2 protein [Parapedobacter sp. DT-150]|uniref:glycosyltransferase family 2 protein n=1 Tax=Parapedobacter sp. DT-150 TaxID=3396162 RepID=UPI003F1D4ADA